MSTLDQRAAPTVTPAVHRPSNRSRAGWFAAGVGLLALAGVSVLWMGYDDEVAPRLAAIASVAPGAAGQPAPAPTEAAATAAAPGTAATASAAPVPSTATTAAAGPAPSTAAELRDTAPPDAAAPEKMPSLHDMLAASATATARTAVKPRDELSQALERPANASTSAGRQHAAPSRAEHGELAQHGAPAKTGNTGPKAAQAEKHHQLAQNVGPAKGEPLKMAQNVAPQHKEQARATAKAASKPATQKAKAVTPDSDVTLLAALMAHLQAKPAPGTRPSTPAEQLKQCRQMNDAGAEQCRARLCAGSAKKEAECKVTPLAKSSSET